MVNPNIIINTAGVTAIGKAYENSSEARIINVDSVEQIALWCQRNSARLIQFSTDFVYEGEKTMYVETDFVNPISIYGQTKLQSELVAQRSNPNTAIIRTSLVYGYHTLSRLNFPLLVKSRLDQGKRLAITADQFRSPTYVYDLANATLDLAHSDFIGTINLAGPQRISIYDFALLIAKEFELDSALLDPIETGTQPQGCSRPLSTGLDISLAIRQLSYDPAKPEVGLSRMYEKMSKT
jgi:dTDP-4-dehydrorhamnose reductase